MEKWEDNKAWFLVLPVFIVVAFSAIIPLMTVVNYSIQDIFGPGNAVFVGTEWFKEMLTDKRLHDALWRQFLFSGLVLLIEIPLGILIALAMPKKGWGVSAWAVFRYIQLPKMRGVLTIVPGALVIWFVRNHLAKAFEEIYGYELGVPVNWSAYEDIAEFFTEHVREIDGKAVFGHNDYGKKAPDLGWRFTDAWLSMAGAGDKGIPNGKPVDEWGIRMEGCQPVGASVARGGAANGPVAKYALRKYMEWLRKYAPPGSLGMDFYTCLPFLAGGSVAQRIFWYTAFVPSMVAPGPTVNEDGTPKWRMAPSPHGPYWEEGMKLGYQDCGSWTFMKSTPLERRKAAWLFAQFCVAKTTSLKKAHVGLTPIRDSDIRHESFTERAPKLGGLVEFYRSPARVAWTPTGVNVPDYPKLANEKPKGETVDYDKLIQAWREGRVK